MPYVERNEAGEIVGLYGTVDPIFHEARNYLATDRLQTRLEEYPHVKAEAERLVMSFDDAVADICARWPEWIDDADLERPSEPAVSHQSEKAEQADNAESEGDDSEATHADIIAHAEDEALNIDDGATQNVDADIPADPDYSGDLRELLEAGAEPADSGGGDSAGEPVAIDPQADPVGAYPGVMVTGDPLKAAQMEATWRVGELEAEKVGEYDLPENARRLAELRAFSMAAKELVAPDLTDAQKEELQALETFDGWLRSIRDHADSLRNAIRAAGSLEALSAIDLSTGWPE